MSVHVHVSPKAFDKILTFVCSKLFTSINFAHDTKVLRKQNSSSSSSSGSSSFETLHFTYNPDYTRSLFSKQNNTLSIVELFYRRQTASLISTG